MTAGGVELRPATDKDEPFLLELYSSTRREEIQLLDWDRHRKEEFLRQQFEAQSRHYGSYPKTTFDVVLVDGAAAGRLYVSRWESEIRIVDIALLPPYRGAGIGSRLIGELIREAIGAGKPLTIHVEKFNPALRLYERLGFVPVEDKGVYLLLEHSAGSESQTKTAS